MPPAIEIGAPLGAKTDGSLAVKATLPQPRAGQYLAPPAMPIAAAPAMKADGAPAVKNEEAEMEATVIDRAEIAPRDALDRAFAPIIYWNRAFAPIIYCLRLASRNRSTSRPPAPRLQLSRVVIYGLAAAIGALSLCAGFMVAFHRTGPIPGPQSHSSPRQLNSPDSPSPPGPTSVAENPSVVPEVPPQPDAVRDAAVEAASPKATSSTTTTHRMMSPKRKSRGATSRVASRSSGGSHAVAISRVPGRTASAPGSRGAMTRSAQRYFHLADQQMHKGNYAAAAANYKRAWRIEENSAAAKGRLARARRAMQAENESIAPPH